MFKDLDKLDGWGGLITDHCSLTTVFTAGMVKLADTFDSKPCGSKLEVNIRLI